jgi:hypothetical protein
MTSKNMPPEIPMTPAKWIFAVLIFAAGAFILVSNERADRAVGATSQWRQGTGVQAAR